jgi:dipeptidyl aminopeptidase/acylaminoacyl peptidase
MSRKVIATILLVLLAKSPVAAQKANFELAERFTTQRMDKMVGTLDIRPRWIEDEPRFWYEFEASDGRNWYLVDARRREKSLLFDQEALAAELTEHFRKPFNAKDLPLKEFEYDTDRGVFRFHVDSIRFTYRFETRELAAGDSVQKEPDMAWATWSPDSTWIAFARKHDLYLMRGDDPDSVEIRLTRDGERWYSYQAEDGDTTSTKRLRSRARWFEDEKKLYVVRQDQRRVRDLWVINSLKARPELETYKYAMPGEDDVPIDEIWAFAVDDTVGVKLDTDRWEDQAIGGVYFNRGGLFTSERSDHVWFLRRDRTWQNVDVCRGDTETGEVTVLWSERSEPYHNTRFMDLAVIGEGEEYLWWSERTGWGQLYRYGADGTLRNRVTDGYFVVGDIERIDTLGQVVYFTGYGREEGVNPYFGMTYRVNFDGTGMELLSPEPVDHDVSISDDARYIVDVMSSVDSTPRSVLRDPRGRVIRELESADLAALGEAGWRDPEPFRVKAADGVTDLYGVMWKPFDFDSTRSYPVVSYVYPGPQTEPFPTRFTVSGSAGRAVSVAQLGLVVVAFGQRGGSPVRSKYYHNFGYGNLRDYPLADNRYGIEQLAARHPWIDASRVGIYGHSGGGFMSTAALLSHPDFYDVAVSSAGNHDNNVYNLWWSEVHNGVRMKTKTRKEKNGDGEEVEVTDTTWEARVDRNPDLAGNLAGHLLLIHGDIDNNVHPANTIRLVDALVKAGKRFDFMLLPGQRHGFGKMTAYADRLTWYYFAEHLLGDYRTNVDFHIPEEDAE